MKWHHGLIALGAIALARAAKARQPPLTPIANTAQRPRVRKWSSNEPMPADPNASTYTTPDVIGQTAPTSDQASRKQRRRDVSDGRTRSRRWLELSPVFARTTLECVGVNYAERRNVMAASSLKPWSASLSCQTPSSTEPSALSFALRRCIKPGASRQMRSSRPSNARR